MKTSKNLYVRLSRVICSLILVFIMSNILLVEETKAQCPPGYSTTTLAMSVYGCDFFVEVCYICPPQGITNGSFMVRKFDLQSSCSIQVSFSEIFDEIYRQLYSNYYVNVLCPNPIPPCDHSERYEIEVVAPVCWKLVNDNDTFSFRACDDTAICEYILRMCKDLENESLKVEVVNINLVGTIICTEPFPVIEDLMQQLNTNEESDCYFVKTPCYP